MAKKRTKIARISTQLEDRLLKAGEVRVSKGLMRARDVKLPVMTDLLMKTPSMELTLKQLANLPEKERRKLL